MAASNAGRLAAFLLIALFANGTLSCAQELAASESASTALLRQMTRSAGVIFAGEVISVQRPVGFAGSGQAASEGIVVIKFRVDAAVRGSASGSVYTLREWAGLWAGGDRYRTGQRLLVFLHSPNADGLSTPVYGATGAISLRGGGSAPGPYDAAAHAADWVVDLRWVEAQATREVTESANQNPVRVPVRRPRSEGTYDPLTGLISSEDPARPDLIRVPGRFPRWTALPDASARAMPALTQVLNLCREWANAAPVSVPDAQSSSDERSSYASR